MTYIVMKSIAHIYLYITYIILVYVCIPINIAIILTLYVRLTYYIKNILKYIAQHNYLLYNTSFRLQVLLYTYNMTVTIETNLLYFIFFK